jgi:hypothetical protein
LLAALACATTWSAAAWAQAPTWRFAPAPAPPPPAGAVPAPDPVPLGEVGQVSFWAPNRGLLITGGTQSQGGVVPAGLYAYDGVGWHELASVCGGAKGRIAWAGPDDFWTISDQRAGQILSGKENQGELEALSLCHFVGGRVAGSYAMPLGEPGSYLEMDAAACLSPSDCWFAGQDGRPPNAGSFHLHWNGGEVTASYDASDHTVTGMAGYNGKLYEGLAIGAEDGYLPGEEPAHPPVIRTIAPVGQAPLCNGAPSSFCNAFLFSAGQTLPVYPEKSSPDALGGFDLATDGSPLGAGATQLWAGADPVSEAPTGSARAQLTILRDAQGSWTQLTPTPSGGSPLPAGAALSGSSSDVSGARRGEPGSGSIAPEPGGGSAWLSLEMGGAGATVALLEARVPQSPGEPSAALVAIDQLPEPGEPVGFRGKAGPIACPAAHDCWMATRDSGQTSGGWLFHLTDGTSPAPNTDPLFDGGDGVISYRPPDSGVPVVYPDGFAEDDSLANQQPPPAPAGPPAPVPAGHPRARKAKPLVTHLKSAFVRRRVLVVSFTLTARAHVRLLGRRDRRVVAQTPRESLRPGRHRLSLTLDPARWPTKLQFEAHPIGSPTSPAGSAESPGSSETIGT